jgi:polyhydroxyalkanoate synthesis regulator phasin
MLNLLEEGFNLGLGVASVTCSKVDDLVKDTLEKVGVKPGEKEDLKAKLVEEGKAAREKLSQSFKEHSEKLAEYMPLSAKLDKILEKLDKLEAEIAALKAEK